MTLIKESFFRRNLVAYYAAVSGVGSAGVSTTGVSGSVAGVVVVSSDIK